MENSGQFRTSWHGFRKQDVLQYLEELNSREFTELQETRDQLIRAQEENGALQEQLAQCRQQQQQAQSDVQALQDAIDEYVQSAQERKAETEELLQLRREKQMWRLKENALARSHAAVAENQREMQSWRERCAAVQAEKQLLEQQLVAAQTETETWQKRCSAWQEKNDQYREMVAHIRDFIAEIRRMEQEMIEACYSKSETELKEMFVLMRDWESKAAQTKERLKTVQQELLEQCRDTDYRLDRLAKEWEITTEE